MIHASAYLTNFSSADLDYRSPFRNEPLVGTALRFAHHVAIGAAILVGGRDRPDFQTEGGSVGDVRQIFVCCRSKEPQLFLYYLTHTLLDSVLGCSPRDTRNLRTNWTNWPAKTSAVNGVAFAFSCDNQRLAIQNFMGSVAAHREVRIGPCRNDSKKAFNTSHDSRGTAVIVHMVFGDHRALSGKPVFRIHLVELDENNRQILLLRNSSLLRSFVGLPFGLDESTRRDNCGKDRGCCRDATKYCYSQIMTSLMRPMVSFCGAMPFHSGFFIFWRTENN